jgi:O-antigen/teichoic acid export membrane protein
MGQDWGASVLSHASATALPLIVVALLGASANAYFYIPYTIVVAFTMVFYGACTSLVVEGALAEDRIRTLAARIAWLYAAIVVPGTVVLVATAPLILLPFGPDYAEAGAPVLRILAIGGMFRAATLLYVAIARLQGKGARILAVHATEAVLMLAGAMALAGPLGLEGVALGWLAAMALAQLSVLRSLARFLHSREATVTPREAPTRPRPEEVVMP